MPLSFGSIFIHSRFWSVIKSHKISSSLGYDVFILMSSSFHEIYWFEKDEKLTLLNVNILSHPAEMTNFGLEILLLNIYLVSSDDKLFTFERFFDMSEGWNKCHELFWCEHNF